MSIPDTLSLPTPTREKWLGFIPVTRPLPPATAGEHQIANPIDAFVIAALEDEGLAPAPQADPYILVRRITIDLTGLPPSPAEVDAFLHEFKSGDHQSAIGNLVDRLFTSPRYGEHLAYHWLDAARYADSDGYESDPLRNMWPWRDV